MNVSNDSRDKPQNDDSREHVMIAMGMGIEQMESVILLEHFPWWDAKALHAYCLQHKPLILSAYAMRRDFRAITPELECGTHLLSSLGERDDATPLQPRMVGALIAGVRRAELRFPATSSLEGVGVSAQEESELRIYTMLIERWVDIAHQFRFRRLGAFRPEDPDDGRYRLLRDLGFADRQHPPGWMSMDVQSAVSDT